jgi:LacI family transcriptional regulator
MSKRISMNDIAEKFEVSTATISYIINGKAREKRISEDLIKRVLDFVAEIDYQPSQLAQSLRTGKSKIIGLMVDDISNPFFAEIAKRIEDKAYQKGYRIILCSTDNNTKKAQEIIRMFRDRNVDGYIIAPPEGIEPELEDLQKDQKPIVVFDRFLSEINYSYVITDNCESTYQAILHFLENGYQRPALVILDSPQSQMVDREKGYLKAVSAHHLPAIIKKIKLENVNDAEVISLIINFIDSNKSIDSILFSSNYFTRCGLEALEKLEVKIPEEMGIISFDDHDLFRFYSPTITAIAQPIEKFADEILKILLKKMDAMLPDDAVVIPSTLIERKSAIKKVRA